MLGRSEQGSWAKSVLSATSDNPQPRPASLRGRGRSTAHVVGAQPSSKDHGPDASVNENTPPGRRRIAAGTLVEAAGVEARSEQYRTGFSRKTTPRRDGGVLCKKLGGGGGSRTHVRATQDRSVYVRSSSVEGLAESVWRRRPPTQPVPKRSGNGSEPPHSLRSTRSDASAVAVDQNRIAETRGVKPPRPPGCRWQLVWFPVDGWIRHAAPALPVTRRSRDAPKKSCQ